MNEAIDFINSTGFPIAVALFTLVRLETTIKKNTEAINGMSTAVALLTHTKGGNEHE